MNDRLNAVIRHPLHRYLGVTSIDSEGGCGRLSITVNENTLSPAGLFHGGVAYILSDVCAYAGFLSAVEPNVDAVTHDIQVSVLQSAKLGDVVDFTSSIAKLGKRLCFIEVKASVAGRVIATAKVTKSVLAS